MSKKPAVVRRWHMLHHRRAAKNAVTTRNGHQTLQTRTSVRFVTSTEGSVMPRPMAMSASMIARLTSWATNRMDGSRRRDEPSGASRFRDHGPSGANPRARQRSPAGRGPAPSRVALMAPCGGADDAGRRLSAAATVAVSAGSITTGESTTVRPTSACSAEWIAGPPPAAGTDMVDSSPRVRCTPHINPKPDNDDTITHRLTPPMFGQRSAAAGERPDEEVGRRHQPIGAPIRAPEKA